MNGSRRLWPAALLGAALGCGGDAPTAPAEHAAPAFPMSSGDVPAADPPPQHPPPPPRARTTTTALTPASAPPAPRDTSQRPSGECTQVEKKGT